jgi:hypothetical protein
MLRKNLLPKAKTRAVLPIGKNHRNKEVRKAPIQAGFPAPLPETGPNLKAAVHPIEANLQAQAAKAAAVPTEANLQAQAAKKAAVPTKVSHQVPAAAAVRVTGLRLTSPPRAANQHGVQALPNVHPEQKNDKKVREERKK